MQVNVLLFGTGAIVTGRDRLTVELSEDQPTCGRLRAVMIEIEPKLQPMLHAFRVAVNHRFARDEQCIGPDDEVALIGLVSGG